MSKSVHGDDKRCRLRAAGALNPHPERVTAEQFLTADFFDPHDLVQLKYEMVRRVKSEGQSVTQTAAAFGFSRPTFYQAKAALEAHGLPGLLSQRRGPRGAHKLTDKVLDFVEERQAADPKLTGGGLAQLVQEQFGFPIHPRSIERALRRRQEKKGGH